MATSGVFRHGFPPRRQVTQQPGKEHVMDPLPQAIFPDYKPANKLLGKVALVTGGDSGIGRAVCYHFAVEGATVAFTYIKGQEDKNACDTFQMLLHFRERAINTRGVVEPPMAIPVDLRFDDNCQRVVCEVVDKFGKIDILVNNGAAQRTRSSIEEVTEEQLERVFRTNIFAYIFLARHAIKHMKEGSSIINTTSVIAYEGSPSILDYTSTKGAIVSFTRALALELVKKGIRVNGVAPGPVQMPAEPGTYCYEDMIESFGQEIPMKRPAQPQEIAPSYVFLACNDSSSFTGQILHPNGGLIVNG